MGLFQRFGYLVFIIILLLVCMQFLPMMIGLVGDVTEDAQVQDSGHSKDHDFFMDAARVVLLWVPLILVIGVAAWTVLGILKVMGYGGV